MVSGWGQGRFLSRTECTLKVWAGQGAGTQSEGENVLGKWLATREVQFWHLCAQKTGVGCAVYTIIG